MPKQDETRFCVSQTERRCKHLCSWDNLMKNVIPKKASLVRVMTCGHVHVSELVKLILFTKTRSWKIFTLTKKSNLFYLYTYGRIQKEKRMPELKAYWTEVQLTTKHARGIKHLFIFDNILKFSIWTIALFYKRYYKKIAQICRCSKTSCFNLYDITLDKM